MIVTTATEEHLNQAAKILFEAYYPNLEEAKEDIRKSILTKECILALEGDTVTGLAIYKRDYSHYANFLSDIVVPAEHRRKGIATRLMKKFIEISRKEQPKRQPYALSSTDVTNKASIKLHTNFGFEELGRIKRLHFGKDEIIYGYKL